MGDGRAGGREFDPHRPDQRDIGGDDADAPARKIFGQFAAKGGVERVEHLLVADAAAIGRIDHHQTWRAFGPLQVAHRMLGELA